MGGSPPPGSKKGGYKPVVRSCVENINWLHFALLHVRDAATPARGRRSVDARDAKFDAATPARGVVRSTRVTRSSSTQATREGAKPKESCLRRWSAIAFLLTQPRDDQTIYTTKYLGATHEIFVWSLLICWTVSLIFTPEMVFNHPAREATWHFNPCFGWDFPPASLGRALHLRLLPQVVGTARDRRQGDVCGLGVKPDLKK